MKSLREKLTFCLIILIISLLSLAAEKQLEDRPIRLLKIYEVVPISFERKDVSKIWGLESEYEFWLNAFNTTFHIYVIPKSWRVNVTIYPEELEDKLLNDSGPSYHYVEGIVGGVEASNVEGMLQINEDMQAQTFIGVIDIEGFRYVVEPAEGYYPSYNSTHVLVYRQSDVLMPIFPFQSHTSEGMKGLTEREIVDVDSYRSALKKLRGKSCTVELVADSYVIEYFNGDVKKMLAEMQMLIKLVDAIYRATDIDEDGRADLIGVDADTIAFYTADSGMFVSNYTGAQGARKFAEECSYRKSNACLSICFTNRNWGGVEGIVFFGPSAGICSKNILDNKGKAITLNTASITLVTPKDPLDKYTLLHKVLITAHQIAHSFGAIHDHSQRGRCSVDSNDYHYIMGAMAGDKKPNVFLFSPCTKKSFLEHMVAKASCFVYPKSCLERGNCEVQVQQQDPCCITKFPYCVFRPGAECSYLSNPECCLTNCLIAPNGSACGITQPDEFNCLAFSLCDGKSPECKERGHKMDKARCGRNMMLTCKNGSCISNFCEDSNLRRCECTEENNRCDLCCLFRRKCLPASRIGTSTIQLFPGHDCNLGAGYCDENGTCIERPENANFTKVKREWLEKNWMHIFNLVLAVLLTIVVVATISLKLNP